MSTEETVVPKKSKGQLFREKHGYSRTMKRNMNKYGVKTPEEYRAIRKQRKKATRKAKPVVVESKHDSKPIQKKKK